MNIQIFGKSKCFDTKKAERYFKERGIRFQRIDLPRFGMSRGELESVIRALGGLEPLLPRDSKEQEAILLQYMDNPQAKMEKLLENPALIQTPVVRNGNKATVGYCPEVWSTWK